ncbi:hypothetical protein BAZOLSSOX_537 [uncultured Gammaproteobacteria bacterium]|nr:hypothetical protein BAZOLSSOX_537 [uncultured Gammaproteobacteria bacterium]
MIFQVGGALVLIHHHTGGLEICFAFLLKVLFIHHHTGGLEI